MKRLTSIVILMAVGIVATAQDGDPIPPEIRTVGDNQSINCLSEPVRLAITVDGWQEGFDYAWSNGSTDSSILVKPLNTAMYTVTVSHLDLGINDVRSFTVQVNNQPIEVANAAFTVDKYTCPGTDLTIGVEADGGHGDLRYAWSFGSMEQAPTVQPTQSTSYDVIITDACGTTASAQVNVQLEDHDPIEVTEAITVDYSCEEQSLELTPNMREVSGGVGHGYQYTFFGAAAGTPISVVPAEAKKDAYRARITDACGAQFAEQTIHLNFKALEVKEAPTLYACSNEPINIVDQTDGFYYWDGTAMHATYEVNAKRSKTYDIRYIDACGKEQLTERKVEVERIVPNVQWNIEQLDRKIYAYAQGAGGLGDYAWYLNGNLVSTEDHVELHDVLLDENELTFEATSDLGCRYEERRSVVFQDGVQIPSAISPNGDGLNEGFRVRFEEELQSFQISIFDRWGQEVYRSIDQNFEWTPNDAQVIGPIGTFAYVLEAQTKGGKNIEKTGVLTTIHAK